MSHELSDVELWKAERRMCAAPVRFRLFVMAREDARLQKELVGGDEPYADDPIIASNRFCNVDREHDAVTRYLYPVRRICAASGADHLVPQMLAARIWNHPPTLERILPIMDVDNAAEALRRIRADGGKTMRGAYMMPVHGNNGRGRSVDDYYLAAVAEAKTVRWSEMTTLAEVAARLTQILGIGDFLANQVCTDLRYVEPFCRAPDVRTFVLCGPGTRRGLDRYIDMNAGPKLGTGPQKMYVERLLHVREELRVTDCPQSPTFRDPNNLANCFCEWDKYERVLQGEVKRLHSYP